jgi:hypothetical protein
MFSILRAIVVPFGRLSAPGLEPPADVNPSLYHFGRTYDHYEETAQNCQVRKAFNQYKR